MAWIITRYAGAGDDTIGPETLTFGEDGKAWTNNATVVLLARSLPMRFMVQGGPGTIEALSDTGQLTGDLPLPDHPDGGVGEGEPEADPESSLALPEEDAEEGGTAVALSPPYQSDDLDMLTVTDLRELATSHGLSGVSRMTKAELVAALVAVEG